MNISDAFRKNSNNLFVKMYLLCSCFCPRRTVVLIFCTDVPTLVCNYNSLVCCFLIPISTCRRDVVFPSNLCLLGVGSVFASRIRMSCRLTIELHRSTYEHTYAQLRKVSSSSKGIRYGKYVENLCSARNCGQNPGERAGWLRCWVEV